MGVRDLATLYATHLSLGVQRELARDPMLSADFVYKHFIHIAVLPTDYNHFNSVRDR